MGNEIGFFGALQIVFIVLKLLNIIDWAWWIVLLPMIVSVIILILGFIFITTR